MTSAPDILHQIVSGLDGVTDGPWPIKEETGWDEAWCDWHDVGPFSLMGPKANANSKHIARCSPDAIREIAEYVSDLEARATAAESTVAALREALDRQCDNMAFVVNHATLPDPWLNKFSRELDEDCKALSTVEKAP